MKKLTVLVSCAAFAAAGSGTALAHGGHGKGLEKSSENHGHHNGRSHKCAKPRRVGFVVRGTFASIDPSGNVTIDLVGANHHARRFLAGATTFSFDTQGAGAPSVRFVGLTGFDQATTTDQVVAIGKLALPKHGCDSTAAATPTIRKVVVRRPGAQDQTQESNG
jgi:hypothetical protein